MSIVECQTSNVYTFNSVRMKESEKEVAKKTVLQGRKIVIMIDTGRLDYSSFFALIVRLSALPFLESTFSIASGLYEITPSCLLSASY